MNHIHGRGTYRLPLELTGFVMRELAGTDDRRSLAAASLVCKAWAIEGARSLFYELHFKTPENVDSDLQVLQDSSERIRNNVRSLVLGPDADDIAVPYVSFGRMLKALLHLPKLQHLRLCSLYLDATEEDRPVMLQYYDEGLTLAYVGIWNMVPTVSNVAYHMVLLSALGKVDFLHIHNPKSHNARWPAAEDLSSESGTGWRSFRRDIPLQVETIVLNCSAPEPIQAWLCGVLWPDQEAILDETKTTSALVWAYPHWPWTTSLVLPALAPLQHMTNLDNLRLSTDFWMCVHWVEMSKQRGIDIAYTEFFPSLASNTRLRTLHFIGVTVCPMNLVEDENRESLRCVWDAMIAMLRTAPPTLDHLELTLMRSWAPTIELDEEDPSTDDPTMLDNLLYEGHPEAVAKQPYDWSMLGEVAKKRGIKLIQIKMHRRQHDEIHAPISDQDELRKRANEVWGRYPNTVRTIQHAMAERCKLEFTAD